MTGLEKIIAQINSDAQQAAQAVLKQANDDVLAISSESDTAVANLANSIRAQAKTQVSNTLAAAESAAALSKRRAILSTKQEIITNLINQAKQDIYQMPDEQYFQLIMKMLVKYASGRNGIILFSQKDLTRMPAFFQSKVDETIGGKLTISLKETRPLDGGFVLLYDDVEENCSISAIFDAATEQLQDTVSKFLFA